MLRSASLFACLAMLGGCADIERRSDFVSIHAGEALAANRAIQTIDPWPREAFDPQMRTDGPRMEDAIRRYRAPEGKATPTPSRPASAVISIQN